jgi:hypothetical protein
LIAASRCALKIKLTFHRHVETSTMSGSALTRRVTGSVRHRATAACLSMAVSLLIAITRSRWPEGSNSKPGRIGDGSITFLRRKPPISRAASCRANLAVDRVGIHSGLFRQRGQSEDRCQNRRAEGQLADLLKERETRRTGRSSPGRLQAGASSPASVAARLCSSVG